MSQINSNKFITDNFLLYSKEAETLYHQYAKDMPIIDYHNHLSAKQIAENKPLQNISEVWLHEDHYKWRGMRANGIDEKYITGSSSNKEKFFKWAQTVPHTIRNPLFHWTQLELKRYFEIDSILQPATAEEIYAKANEVLASKTPADLLQAMKVEVVCTTDDPTDSLEYHQQIANLEIFTKVYPTFRPDKLLLIQENWYLEYLEKMEQQVTFTIKNLDDFLTAIQSRVDFFHQNGCRVSDYGLEQIFAFDFNKKDVEVIFEKRLKKNSLTMDEANSFASFILYELCKMYFGKGWAQQFHLGALRNNNARLQEQIGADAGCDSIGDKEHAVSMSILFNRLDRENCLSKTIIYNVNPSQNEVFASMAGNFNGGGIPGKMQWGSAWWFLDQKDGMEKQLNTLSNVGLLSRFIGMLTDSRSFLSFPRHEYFRRILCNMLAEDVKKGLIPDDLNFIGKMVQDICYHNAVKYFDFK
ncbi:glucuronate isomerase [Lutimonas sp.]|uniref:glucuronate isomerase n=1 Tax=Lutimonas sp. TaxID=1872403 RepID=UPI003D9BA47A